MLKGLGYDCDKEKHVGNGSITASYSLCANSSNDLFARFPLAALLDTSIADILGLSLNPQYDGQSLLRLYQQRDKIIYALGVPGFKILPK